MLTGGYIAFSSCPTRCDAGIILRRVLATRLLTICRVWWCTGGGWDFRAIPIGARWHWRGGLAIAAAPESRGDFIRSVAELPRTTFVGLIGAIGRAERSIRPFAHWNIAFGARHDGVLAGTLDWRLRLLLGHRCCLLWWGRWWHCLLPACRWRRGRIRLLQETLPNRRRQRAPDDVPHRGMVVIPDPDTNDKRVIKADEPSVPVILRRARLPRSESWKRSGATGALHDDSAQKLDQFILILAQLMLRLMRGADRH